ncbi:hypothetical protein KC19_6G113100 [Ceratodon purpureus]|uniref:Uncharacterized protein n=1 Tax=Ceratodon purpureus TaxID=3225 RepID=A0A8T0HDX2_CERPU|nr:hypothetical protein KC19_6G113100 [Ceratodon purpureus]
MTLVVTSEVLLHCRPCTSRPAIYMSSIPVPGNQKETFRGNDFCYCEMPAARGELHALRRPGFTIPAACLQVGSGAQTPSACSRSAARTILVKWFSCDDYCVTPLIA